MAGREQDEDRIGRVDLRPGLNLGGYRQTVSYGSEFWVPQMTGK